MNDLISRQAAIDAVGDVHPLDYNAMAVVERLRNLPSVQPQRWIPVTEALPEKDGQYVVCSDGYVFPAIYHQRGVYDGNVVWSDYHWTDLETGIIQWIDAWMPLPPSYKGGQDET